MKTKFHDWFNHKEEEDFNNFNLWLGLGIILILMLPTLIYGVGLWLFNNKSLKETLLILIDENRINKIKDTEK